MPEMDASARDFCACTRATSEPFLISLHGCVNCGQAQNMRTYQALEHAQPPVKEVIGSRDNNDRKILWARPVKHIGQRNRFIQFAVDDERVAHDVRHRPFGCGGADQYHVSRRSIRSREGLRRFRGDETSKRKAGQRDRQLIRNLRLNGWQTREYVDQVQEILGLPFAFIMFSARAAYAAEVRSHCDPAETCECPRDGGNYLVVEGTAVKRMRVPDVDDSVRRAGGPVERQFYAAADAVDQ